MPRPDHVVVVILENERRSSIIRSPHAPYLNKLAARGANLTRSYGVTHPSQPNYLALFSGSTHGVTSNGCPRRFPEAGNLSHQLRTAGLSFAGYAESLPKVGFRGCASGRYRRKAQSMGELHHPSDKRQPALRCLPARPSQATDRVVHESEYVLKHA